MFSSFPHYLDALRPRLDDACEGQLRSLLRDCSLDGLSPLAETLRGGKRIRGGLLCLTSEALGGSLDSALPRAVALELIHSASLIHDDFVDQDSTRRNLPATWTLAGARRAVLLGDLIFASAIEMMNRLSREDGLVASQAIAQVSQGAFHEQLEPSLLAQELKRGGFDGLVYGRIISLKTSILFGAACRLGGVTVGLDLRAKENLRRYGLRVGEAYQIADDLKEVKHHLSTRSIRSHQLAALIPAFLYFLKELPPRLVGMLEQEQAEIDAPALDSFRVTARLMAAEIERRLQSAASELPADFPKNAHGELMRQAPWDLIRMFNDSL